MEGRKWGERSDDHYFNFDSNFLPSYTQSNGRSDCWGPTMAPGLQHSFAPLPPVHRRSLVGRHQELPALDECHPATTPKNRSADQSMSLRCKHMRVCAWRGEGDIT